MNNNKIYIFILTVLIWGVISSGCMKFALRLSPDLFNNISKSIFEECDPVFAQNSIPANLKLLEGILKSDPENQEILKLLSMGFCGYSMLFIERDNPEQASDLYYRSLQYGLKALKCTENIQAINQETIYRLFEGYKEKTADSFLWTTISWNLWVNNNLDKPEAISQIGLAQLCIDRLTELDPERFYGLPYLLKAVSLSARSPMLGGDYDKAKIFFEKAIAISEGNLFLSKYFFARYYCVGIQKKDLFISLLEEITKGDPKNINNVCLINMVIQEKAKALLNEIDEYFI